MYFDAHATAITCGSFNLKHLLKHLCFLKYIVLTGNYTNSRKCLNRYHYHNIIDYAFNYLRRLVRIDQSRNFCREAASRAAHPYWHCTSSGTRPQPWANPCNLSTWIRETGLCEANKATYYRNPQPFLHYPLCHTRIFNKTTLDNQLILFWFDCDKQVHKVIWTTETGALWTSRWKFTFLSLALCKFDVSLNFAYFN